jgi:hypothetical protein
VTKLKLADLGADKPVRVSVDLPAEVHRDLIAYAGVLGQGQASVTPEKLIAPMLARFMATDRAFLKARRASVQSGAG